jgi:hypothetical protein
VRAGWFPSPEKSAYRNVDRESIWPNSHTQESRLSGLGPKPRSLVVALAGSGESAALGLPSTSLQFVQGLDALLG